MNIELYSVRGFTGSALRDKLEEALASHHLSHGITEIHHVDQFIKAGLTSVPAFRIGEKIILHPPDGIPDETVQKVMDYLQQEHIHSILVPVDFSVESSHAMDYASMMARHLGLGLTLVHVHQTLYDPISAGALDTQLLQDSQKRIEDVVEKLNREHEARGLEVPVRAHIEVGEPVGNLIDMLEHGQYEMLIMGTKATDTAIRRIFGTISSDVSRRSTKPVMVVPPKAEVKFPGKMVVGFTEELMLNGTLEYILQFGAKNDVFFDFVHVTDDQEGFAALKHKLHEKLVLNRDLLCGFNIRAERDEEHKIHEVLFEYAHQARAGLVILISHRRGFLDSLRHESVTKKALQNPPVPIMILHHPAGK